MTDRVLPGILVIGFLVLLLGAMWFAWRARSRRDRDLVTPTTPPEELSGIISAAVFYVATTPRDRPFERLAIAGLDFRARARMTVADEGVLLEIPGQNAFFIASRAIQGAEPATWTIDRVVERDGLVCLRWVSDDTQLDSYVRVPDASHHRQILDALASISHEAAPGQPGESESSA